MLRLNRIHRLTLIALALASLATPAARAQPLAADAFHHSEPLDLQYPGLFHECPGGSQRMTVDHEQVMPGQGIIQTVMLIDLYFPGNILFLDEDFLADSGAMDELRPVAHPDTADMRGAHVTPPVRAR